MLHREEEGPPGTQGGSRTTGVDGKILDDGLFCQVHIHLLPHSSEYPLTDGSTRPGRLEMGSGFQGTVPGRATTHQLKMPPALPPALLPLVRLERKEERGDV